MKKLLLILFSILILGINQAVGQKDPAARKILDAAAANFSKSGAVRASFSAENFNGNNSAGAMAGMIIIKGRKFFASTNESMIWYNGKTEWTYIKSSNEVNVSTPNDAEQQKINPYAFVNLYKKGFNYTVTNTSLRGKSAYEIHLTAEIIVNSFSKKEKVNDASFTFNRKDYPNAEIVDLR
jgi:outer membrane lipoprotein-sorting protein